MTAIQSLTESLHDAQRQAHVQAKETLKNKSNQYLQEQDHVNAVLHATQAAAYRPSAGKRVAFKDSHNAGAQTKQQQQQQQQQQPARNNKSSKSTATATTTSEPLVRRDRPAASKTGKKAYRQTSSGSGSSVRAASAPLPEEAENQGPSQLHNTIHPQPWYPPPNKTHGSHLPRGLKQVCSRDRLCVCVRACVHVCVRVCV